MENAQHEAQAHWQRHLQAFPPDVQAYKQLVWVETINEPWKGSSTRNNAEWLARFSYYTALEALAAGYNYAAFGWSTGEPEYGAPPNPALDPGDHAPAHVVRLEPRLAERIRRHSGAAAGATVEDDRPVARDRVGGGDQVVDLDVTGARDPAGLPLVVAADVDQIDLALEHRSNPVRRQVDVARRVLHRPAIVVIGLTRGATVGGACVAFSARRRRRPDSGPTKGGSACPKP